MSLQKRHLSSAECIINRHTFSEGPVGISRGENTIGGYLGPTAPPTGTAGTAGTPMNIQYASLNSVASPVPGVRSPGYVMSRVLSSMTQSIPHMGILSQVAASKTLQFDEIESLSS